MGASQSISGDNLLRKDVLEATKSTRKVMDILLEYMLKEISVRDFYLLSSPGECKKYVLFLANSMYNQFYELGLAPTKDKKGILMFRPIKELIEPSESDKVQRQSLCLMLSFFYTRIFQIVGALALTLIDDANVMSDKGLLIEGDSKRLYAPGMRPYIASGGNISSSLIGGALPDFGVFNFIKPYIASDATLGEQGYRTRSLQYTIYFKKAPGATHSATFAIGYKGAKRYSYLDITAEPKDIENTIIAVTLKKVRYIKRGATAYSDIEIPSSIVDEKKIVLEGNETSEFGRRVIKYGIKNSTISVSQYFENVFEKVVPFIRALTEDDVEYLTGVSNKITVSEKDVVDELRLERTIRNLTKEKPLAHCIARALQLLRTAPFTKEDGYSSICKARFLEVEKGVSRSGIPLPGADIATSPGLAALSQLFYDTVEYGMPKIRIGSVEKYIAFMRSMATLYGDNGIPGEPRTNSDLEKGGLKGIKNRRDRVLCSSITTDIKVPAAEVPTVYTFVNKLYRKQIEHAGKAGAIFKMLFNIQSDKSGRFRVSLNERIIKFGIPEIARINSIAIDTLTDYYKNCEFIYLQGVQIVLNNTPIPRPIKGASNIPIATAPP